MTTEGWTALGGVLTALVAAVGGALATYMMTRAKIDQEKEDAAILRYKELLEFQGRQITALQKEVEALRLQIAALQNEHLHCHAALHTLYTWSTFSHALNVRYAKQLGLDPAVEVPPLPSRPVIQVTVPRPDKVPTP
jgi:hypothetical protein